MRTRVPKTRRTWLLIALCVVLSLVITILEARGRPPRSAPNATEPTPASPQPASRPAPEHEVVEFELSE